MVYHRILKLPIRKSNMPENPLTIFIVSKPWCVQQLACEAFSDMIIAQGCKVKCSLYPRGMWRYLQCTEVTAAIASSHLGGVCMWTWLRRRTPADIRLITLCEWSHFKSNLNVGAERYLGDTTGAVWRHFVFFSFVWSRVHQLLPLYWIWQYCCFPLKLQKCFMDSNTSPTPPPA